ncbi:MAG: sulfotransferase family 2 domain-containing protein [Desulfovibrio sp.]|nr:sulfotransferase family 2 domain-containing protein [Desulfovibrio sp.]
MPDTPKTDAPPLFFLHFPRTAGTTVDDIFAANYPAEQILKIYSQEEFKKYQYIDEAAFARIRYITGHLLLTSTNPTQFYGKPVRAFTFLRDPVKRLHSEYIFLKTWKNQHLYEYLNSQDISFSQYIASTDKLLRYRGKNFMTRCISGDPLEKTDLAASLAKAKHHLEHSFLFFGLQERFMESMLLLSRQAELPNILHQKRNALTHAGTQAPMSAKEAELAQEYNSADMELYRFAQELFARRIEQAGPEFQKQLKEYTFINAKYQKISNLLYERVAEAQDETDGIALSKDIRW